MLDLKGREHFTEASNKALMKILLSEQRFKRNQQGFLFQEDTAFADASEAEDPGIRYQVETDQKLLDQFDKDGWVKVVRTMQLVNDKLYPPMAKTVGKAAQDAMELGVVYKADEHPESITTWNDDHTIGKVSLGKGGGLKPLRDIAYAPYFHAMLYENGGLNDQLLSEYKRLNLVLVVGYMPKSELTSGYTAKYSPKTVGLVSWHSGHVSAELKEYGQPQRHIFISRWFKGERVMSHEEEAAKIAELVKDTLIAIPVNVVTPQVRVELEKIGVPIGKPIGLKKFEVEKYFDGNRVKPEVYEELGIRFQQDESEDSSVMNGTVKAVSLADEAKAHAEERKDLDFDSYKTVKAYLRKTVRGKEIVNKATRITARIAGTGIDKSLSSKAVNKSIVNGFSHAQHYEAVANIAKFLRNLYWHQSKKTEKAVQASSLSCVSRCLSFSWTGKDLKLMPTPI